jgi:hypothetical protein
MKTIHAREVARNNFLRHRDPPPQRAEHTTPGSSPGAAFRLRAAAVSVCSAAVSTVEALVYSLRYGEAALTKPITLRRLSELDRAQLKAVCRRLQNFNPEIAPPWSPKDVAALIARWRELHERR